MFEILDRLAGWWLDWRTEKKIMADPSLRESLKEFHYHRNGAEMTFISPAIAVMADEASQMLERNHAENYVQFDMMPRVDRGLRPVRVTVQWADGKSPAERVQQMQAEFKRLEDEQQKLFITLRDMMEVAEKACELELAQPAAPIDAVNWADLHCVEARHTINHLGDEVYQVLIEEASPSAQNLQRFVREFLEDANFKNVEVITEW